MLNDGGIYVLEIPIDNLEVDEWHTMAFVYDQENKLKLGEPSIVLYLDSRDTYRARALNGNSFIVPAPNTDLFVGGAGFSVVFDSGNDSRSLCLDSQGGVTIRRLYASNLVDNKVLDVLLVKNYYQIVLTNIETKQRIFIPNEYVTPQSKNGINISMKVPYEDILPAGTYDLEIDSPLGKSNAVRVNVSRPRHIISPIDLDFSDKSHLEDYFYATHKAWGGSNGGVVKENIKLAADGVHFIAHGDKYHGTVQGVNRDGTPKYHTEEDDPDYGKMWVHRVGACIQTKKAMGFGRYEVNFKLVGENGSQFALGVCAAIWTFFYNEEYVGSPFYNEIAAEGISNQGSIDDGFYAVRNHEIDIELPSHLDGGIRHQPSFQNMKCNSWIGEMGSGEGTVGMGEEYISRLTPIGLSVNDGEYHNFRFDWYPNKIEFYVDDVLKQTLTSFIPDIPGHMTIGLWFPSSPHPVYPWLVRNGWAGGDVVVDPETGEEHQIANWDTQEMVMNHFKFTPFLQYDNYIRDKGESFPFGSTRSLVGELDDEQEDISIGGILSNNGPTETPDVEVEYVYKVRLGNVDFLQIDGNEVTITGSIVTYHSSKATVGYVASKDGYQTDEGILHGTNSVFEDSAPIQDIRLTLLMVFRIEVPEEQSAAVVTINGIQRNSVRARLGETINYSVSLEGYNTVTGSYTFHSQVDQTIQIELTPIEGTLPEETLTNDVTRVVNAIKSIESDDKIVWTHTADIHTQLAPYDSDNYENGAYSTEDLHITQADMDSLAKGKQGYLYIQKGVEAEVRLMRALQEQPNISLLGMYNTGDLVDRSGISQGAIENGTEGNLVNLAKTLKDWHINGISGKFTGISGVDFAIIPGNHDAKVFSNATEDYIPAGLFDAAQYTEDNVGTYTQNVPASRADYSSIWDSSLNTYKVFPSLGIIVALFDFYNKDGSVKSSGRWNDLVSAIKAELTINPTYKVVIFCHQPPYFDNVEAYGFDFWRDKLNLSSSDVPKLSYIGASSNTGKVISEIGPDNIIAFICGHKHTDIINIANGVPIIHSTVMGLLVTNDELTRRRNYYDAATLGGYTAEATEINTIAATSVNVYCFDKQHSKLYQFRIGAGPDVVYDNVADQSSDITINSFGEAKVAADELSSSLKECSIIKCVATPFALSASDIDSMTKVNLIASGGYKMTATMELENIDGTDYYRNPFIPKGWHYVVIGYNLNHVTYGNVTDYVVDSVVRSVED